MTAPIFSGWSPVMAVATWANSHWTSCTVAPAGPLPVHPGAMAIQFGQSVFEGCKAHRTDGGSALAFRLDDHHQRLVASCERLCMPAPSRELFRDAVRSVASRRSAWDQPFASSILYIRPVIFGTDDHVMPTVSSRHVFVVLTAPLRPFESTGLRLWIERRYSRAAPGGLGASKTAANYAHQLLPTARARAHGADAVLWLDCTTHSVIEEASTMNVFFVVSGRVLTPALGDTVLAGITRRSVIAILEQRLGIAVEERSITLDDLVTSGDQLDEVFCASTALGVQPVIELIDGDRQIALAGSPDLTAQVRRELQAIQRGAAPSTWVTEVPIETETIA